MSNRHLHVPLGTANFLSVLEGIEGGFAIFVGIVAGLYFQAVNHDILVATGLISVIVSAFNSSAVRYASEHYLDELDGREKRNKLRAYFFPALTEFITYILVSIVAVLPLLLIQDSPTAISLTTLITVVILFGAGWYRGHLLGRHSLRDGLEMAGLGVAIIIIGASSGVFLAGLVG
ncbi:MAG TPA: VIT1/CCC1 transporter family protein [Candidatus Saccharimonadales bacterium]|jgi:VIT1/CCC1 family predicted Fe2+/Mn2+ transporter